MVHAKGLRIGTNSVDGVNTPSSRGKSKPVGNLRRSAVSTITNCKLLKLQREDYAMLSGEHPNIGKRIRATAEKREEMRDEARDGEPG